ncbi:hypothetical protein J5991_05605 [Methanocorpusculum sp.]|nr:hypothetical protein [Methanocorpusculum sp.]
MGAEVVLVPATCVEAGTNVSVCDYGCGETKTIPVVALGHKDSDTDSDTLCDLCGSDLAEPDEGDLHEHIYVLQSVEGNVGTLECNCGDTKTETYVAQVAGKYYTNLAWAIDNASVENVLVLLEDANSEIPKKVAINLNGKNATFTYDNINNVTILSPKGEGTLEVTANGKTVVFGEKVVADNLLPVAVAYTKTGATYSEVDVYSAEGLVWAGETDLRTNEADKGTINIMTNLDMTGLAYYPINNMFITIDGNGNTISNLDCLNDDYSGKSGFLGYGGACTIKDLTLHNVKATGTQVGAFAGGAEALKLENCKLSGHVELTWEQNPADASYQEEYSGIGTVAGISVGITLSSVDISTAEIIIDMRGMDTLAVKASSFPIVGYLPETKYSSPDITGVNQNGAKITILYDGLTQTEDEEGNDLFTVSSGDGLATLMDMVGLAGVGDQGVVFEKAAKIDMSKHDWTPIKVDGYHGADIMTFEGNGATITGLTAPLFAGGFAGGSGIVIKDLTIADSEITSANSQGIGAFVECADSMDEITLINCHLLNSKIIINGESRVGGLVGWTAGYNKQNDGPVDSYITLEDCSVIGCELKAEGSVGGLIGHAGANAATFTTITNCIVKDNTLTSTDSGWRVGVVVGTAHVGELIINNIDESGNTFEQAGMTQPDEQSNLYGSFIPVTTGLMVIDGEYFVSNSDALEEALSLETEEIVVILAADITLAGGTSTTYGGANTQTITINGNGHKLTYSDSYRTYIKLTNPDGKLVLSNMKLYRETTNTNTHYHNNNMQFCCDVEMNDVEFNKGIMLDGGITAVLNEVKIPKNTVGTYALFIFAGSEVTLDGCTITSATGIDGRGIKIVDEDMTGTIPSTKLSVSNTKFTTASKAAVLVGSKGGADIAWGTGNDISGVAKDSTNAVWVDEDYAAYYNKVTVTGCTMVQEGLFVVTDDNQDGCQDDFQEAISNGKKVISLPEGTYTLKNTAAAGKTLTIVGTEDTKISVTDGLTYAVGATVAFDGVTILSEPEGAGYTNGFADFKYATFNNCVINGTLGLDFSCEFNGCTFNVDGNYYNVWTWGAGTVTFNDCTFNCDGKALLVYANVLDNGNNKQTVNINGCTFNDLGDDTVTGKAAIEITNTYNDPEVRTYDVIITNIKVNGFAQSVPGAGDFNAAYGSVEGSDIGTKVWGNKCKLPNTQINVMIDGVDVY